MSRICPDCGRSWEDVRSKGRLGCAGCWNAFGTELSTLLLESQGADRHVLGSGPLDQARGLRKLGLETKLQEALSHEDYAEAGRLRDLLREDPA